MAENSLFLLPWLCIPQILLHPKNHHFRNQLQRWGLSKGNWKVPFAVWNGVSSFLNSAIPDAPG